MSAANRCFVIMPYGPRKDIDGNEIDFDEVYEFVIKPAVEKAGVECVRCDDFAQPGWIHDRMLRHIWEDGVAVVDISMLNPNVFYELGIRHALRRSVTVLIRRKGTTPPFNIAGMSSIEYTTNPRGVKEAQDEISRAITAALRDPENVDSLVHKVIPLLDVQEGPDTTPKRLTKVQTFEFPLVQNPQKRLALITGDREEITVGDVWVSSENTNMQLDRFYGASTSATIRYLGAKKNAGGNVIEDTIGDEVARKMADVAGAEVAPATVIVTPSGALRENNNVKWIFHVASVRGEPREGYRPVQRIDHCVKNALREAGKPAYKDDNLSSMIFPIFGTGPGGGNLREHAERCFGAAVEYLEANPESPIRAVYFYVFTDRDLEICSEVMIDHPRLTKP